MTTYVDLSPYKYGDCDPAKPTVNIGWLGRGSVFDIAEVGSDFRQALLELIAGSEVNVMRGLHDCELCDVESPVIVTFSGADRGRLFLGNSEVHVPGVNGIWYAAPTLIVHYLDVHRYRPPAEFVDAVLAMAQVLRTQDSR